MLLIAGDQVPETPLSETVGNAAMIVPAQTGAIGAKLGVTNGVMGMVSVVLLAH